MVVGVLVAVTDTDSSGVTVDRSIFCCQVKIMEAEGYLKMLLKGGLICLFLGPNYCVERIADGSGVPSHPTKIMQLSCCKLSFSYKYEGSNDFVTHEL